MLDNIILLYILFMVIGIKLIVWITFTAIRYYKWGKVAIRFGTWKHRVRWESYDYAEGVDLDITHYYRICWWGVWTPFCRKEIQ